jgi:hypothetical protein
LSRRRLSTAKEYNKSSVNYTQQGQIGIKMMATAHNIENVSDRSYKNDEAPHGELARSQI